MYQEAFKKLELEEVAMLLEQINPEFDTIEFDPIQTTILAQDISFYPGYRFFEIADYSVSPAPKRFVVFNPDSITVLDWTNGPVYQLNLNVPVTLNDESVCDYARFFFTYIRGKHGRFIIAETVDDIQWKEEPPPAARKAIGKMLLPITINEQRPDGSYLIKSTMMFRDSLFRADVEIKSNGLVTISNEELLVEDMPVLDDTFGQ